MALTSAGIAVRMDMAIAETTPFGALANAEYREHFYGVHLTIPMHPTVERLFVSIQSNLRRVIGIAMLLYHQKST